MDLRERLSPETIEAIEEAECSDGEEDEMLKGHSPDSVIAYLERDMSRMDTWKLDWLLDHADEIDDGRKRILAHLIVPEIRDHRHPSPKYNLGFYTRHWIEETGQTWDRSYQEQIDQSLQSINHSKTIEWFRNRNPGILPPY